MDEKPRQTHLLLATRLQFVDILEVNDKRLGILDIALRTIETLLLRLKLYINMSEDIGRISGTAYKVCIS